MRCGGRTISAVRSSASGEPERRPRRASDPTQPLSPYAVAPLAGAHDCASFSRVSRLETVRLRYFKGFGPRQAAGVSGPVYPIACGQRTSLLEPVAESNRRLGTNVRPEHTAPRGGDVRPSQADITRARVDLGYQPRIEVREELRRCLRAFISCAPA